MRHFISSILAILTVLLIGFSPFIATLTTDTLTTTHTTDTLTTTPTPDTPPTYTIIAAFDLDDTLIHSSPAFDYTKAQPKGTPFWSTVNTMTPTLCPSLPTGTTILKAHQSRNTHPHTKVYTYIITARSGINTTALTQYLIDTYHVDGVYYTGKTPTTPKINKAIVLTNLARQHKATHTYFYGDSDSDIKAGLEANYNTSRIIRPPFSTYTYSNNPGKYNEALIPWNSTLISPREKQTSTSNPLKENSMFIFIVLALIMIYTSTSYMAKEATMPGSLIARFTGSTDHRTMDSILSDAYHRYHLTSTIKSDAYRRKTGATLTRTDWDFQITDAYDLSHIMKHLIKDALKDHPTLEESRKSTSAATTGEGYW